MFFFFLVFLNLLCLKFDVVRASNRDPEGKKSVNLFLEGKDTDFFLFVIFCFSASAATRMVGDLPLLSCLYLLLLAGWLQGIKLVVGCLLFPEFLTCTQMIYDLLCS